MVRLLAGIMVLWLAACASVPKPPALTPGQLAEVQQRLYVYVAEERRKLNADAKPLQLDPGLTAAAQAHSDAMAKNRRFDPTNAAESNIAIQRIAANPTFQGYVGENSAMQYFTPGAALDADKVARTFLEVWLKSPEHRDHILFPAFDKTGIGIAANDNEIFAAQIFVTEFELRQAPAP